MCRYCLWLHFGLIGLRYECVVQDIFGSEKGLFLGAFKVVEDVSHFVLWKYRLLCDTRSVLTNHLENHLMLVSAMPTCFHSTNDYPNVSQLEDSGSTIHSSQESCGLKFAGICATMFVVITCPLSYAVC